MIWLRDVRISGVYELGSNSRKEAVHFLRGVDLSSVHRPVRPNRVNRWLVGRRIGMATKPALRDFAERVEALLAERERSGQWQGLSLAQAQTFVNETTTGTPKHPGLGIPPMATWRPSIPIRRDRAVSGSAVDLVAEPFNAGLAAV